MPGTEHNPAARILALGDIPPRGGVIERPVIAEIEAWLGSHDARPVLWVHGPAGSGRTTAVASAVRRTAGAGRHVKRVSCFTGISIEEVLDDASNLLRQTGSDALARVLDQRSHSRSKVAVLFQTLRDSPFLLWIDDADQLLPAGGALDHLLDGCRSLDRATGRVVVVSESPPPRESEERFKVLEVDAIGCPWSEKLAPKSIDAVVPGLSQAAWAVLQAVAVLPPEPSRQALRDVAAAVGVTLALKATEDDPVLREIESAGLITLAPAQDDSWTGPPAVMPAPVRRFVRERLERDTPDAWKALNAVAGTSSLRLASSTGNLWHFVAAWRAFRHAELHDEAYEIQKSFLQDLIQRGCFDLARYVIEETVRASQGIRRAVALGNLAILHKNSGELTRALELYGEVRDEFVGLGDPANAARVLHQIGNTQYLMGDYAAAVASYEQSLEISTEMGDASVAAATRIQLANVQYQRGEREDALEGYLETLRDVRVANDRSLTAAVELQIGQIHLEGKRYVEADSHLREAETSSRACGDLRGLVKILEAQGMVARERREYDLARARYDDACRTAGELGDPVEAAAALVLAGDVERMRLQLADALRCYYKARQVADSYAAGGAAVENDADAVRKRIAERIESLAQDMGPEVFERLERNARGL